MCTLSVVTRSDGYRLAMNRDERVDRAVAAPPSLVKVGHTSMLYPRDSAGGTWVAANEHGTALALLNWNGGFTDGDVSPTTRSRGLVIPALACSASSREVQATFQGLALEAMLPFRLVAVFPNERKIWEWRWDQKTLELVPHGWEPRHWFSSSLSDEQASLRRGAACANAWSEEGAGSIRWLRSLHASHVDGPGAFSLCVHREAVRTLSYTELICTPATVRCNYFSGSPCAMQEVDASIELDRHRTDYADARGTERTA